MGNYRPISLVNNDLKILAKILSNRLASFKGNYIHKDQVGFMPGRQGPDQIWRAIDVISLMKLGWDESSPQEGYLLSLELQTAFDMVSWSFLFSVLNRWGFSPNFTSVLL